MSGDDLAHREHVAMKMHRRLGCARRSGSECEQTNIVASGVDVVESRLAVAPSALPARSRRNERCASSSAERRRLFQLTDEANVANRMIDLRALGDDAQFLGAQ